MLNLSEIHFPMHCDHEPHNPPKPRYTVHEDMEAASREMYKTIGRMLDFEKQLNDKVEKMLSLVASDNVTFKETFNNAYRVFLEDVRKEVNGYESNMDSAFRLFTTTIEHDYASLSDDCKAQISEYYNDVILYIKTNLKDVSMSIVREMINDGTIATITLETYDKIKKHIYGGLTDNVITSVQTGAEIADITIGTPNTVYDFKGATINSIVINTTGATIKNAIVKNCLVKSGSRNCVLENVRFENNTQCVVFEATTWAFNFRDCSFIGGGNTIAMNAGENTNTTLILTNCYFYNCKTIIHATAGFACSIIGGWCDHAECVVLCDNGNCDIAINGFDFEVVTHIFKCSGYTFTNLCIDGIVGGVTSAVDITSGIFNLIFNATVSRNIKLFSDTCPATCYCNVPTHKGAKYRFTGSVADKDITAYIAPNATIEMLAACHVGKINWVTDGIEVYTIYGKYTKNTALNAVTPVWVKNTVDAGNNALLTVSTYNVI